MGYIYPGILIISILRANHVHWDAARGMVQDGRGRGGIDLKKPLKKMISTKTII